MREFEDKITKKSNLLLDDSISTYGVWGAQQNPNVFETFHNFLDDVKPSRILEIGTSIGGLTSFLNYTLKKLDIQCSIISYDINRLGWYDDMINDGIDIRIENIFHENYSIVNNEVVDFIQSNGVTLILCDGGNKIGEFNLLSNYMKVGDFIMAHDYSENREIFDEKIYKKIWNWHEISDSDIAESVKRNNLIDYNKDNFNNVVWVCKKKI